MVFDDMIVDLLSNKKPNPTVTEFSIRSRILTHAATRRRSDVVTTSLCTFQRRRMYFLNETPNDVSMVRHQDVSVVRIHDVPLVRLYDISCTSQMKHPITWLWCDSTMSQSCQQVSTTFSSYFLMTFFLQVSTAYFSIKSNKFFYYQSKGKQEKQFGL